MNLLVTGAILRPNGFTLGEGKFYGQAQLISLNGETGESQVLLSINEGSANFPDQHPNLEFTVGDTDGSDLWLAMDTEIHHYTYPNLKRVSLFSHPCFHNVHSVAVRGDLLFVTSTGLDMVVVLDKHTGVVQEYLNAEHKPAWHRFSPGFDYRKIHSTRPHDCHPNYVFWINDNPWVTRCTQEDAVMLHDPSMRIDISGPDKEISVHDGVVQGDTVYFTTVDGCIIAADTTNYNIRETIDLKSLKGYGGLRGWCRGLYIKDNIFYVGFSRLRQTNNSKKIAWIKNILKRGKPIEQCSVLAIDITKREIVADYIFPDDMLDAIYSILPEPK